MILSFLQYTRVVGILLLVSISMLIASACAAANDDDRKVVVFAAASLGHVFHDIQKEFETATSNQLSISYGASQTLAQQISSGAPADIFISAGKSPVNFLVERNRLASEPVNLLTNQLVVVVRQNLETRISSVKDLANSHVIRRIALADPELAPAGQYARESLTTLGLWNNIQNKLITGTDVRSTLAYIESGNADVALVYATDAKLARNVKVLDIVPYESHTPIVYPAALIKGSQNSLAALKFLAFLKDRQTQKIFSSYGFIPME